MGRRSKSVEPQDVDDARDSSRIVARAFDVLAAFDGFHTSLSNSEIAERTNLPRSTVSRLTSTLTQSRHLRYLPAVQRYRFGPAALALGTRIFNRFEFRAALHQEMTEMAAVVPGTVGLVTREGLEIVYLLYARAKETVALSMTTGSRVPLVATVGGHVCFTLLPAEARALLLAKMAESRPADAERLKTDYERNAASLAEHGYLVRSGLLSPFIIGCAAPVVTSTGEPDFVLTVGVLTNEYDEARVRAEVAPRLLALASYARNLLPAMDLASGQVVKKSLSETSREPPDGMGG